MKNIEIREGQFYYAPHGKGWGIFRRHYTENGCWADDHIEDYPTAPRARAKVYELNGWRR